MPIISLTGTSSSGKSTLIKGWMEKYPKYKTPQTTYRDIPNLSLYGSGTRESQEAIQGFMCDQHQMYWSQRDSNKNVIHDRCLLDNLACTLWLWLNQSEDSVVITDDYLEESFKKTNKSLSNYHVIFFLPVSKFTPTQIREDLDLEWRKNIDFILNRFYQAYKGEDNSLITSTFELPFEADLFPKKNCSALIEITGDMETILENASIGFDDDGDIFGGFCEPSEQPTPESGVCLYDGSGKEVNENSENSGFEVSPEGDLIDLEFKPNITL